MTKITKGDIAEAITEKCDCSKSTSIDYIDAFLEEIVNNLKNGNSVALTGFGIFSVTDRKARVGRNPQSGEAINIPAKRVPKFKAGKGLKEAVAAQV